MRDLQVGVGAIVVADDGQSVSAYRDRRIKTDVPNAVQRGNSCRCAGNVSAVRNPQVQVGVIVVADDGQSVSAYRDRR